MFFVDLCGQEREATNIYTAFFFYLEPYPGYPDEGGVVLKIVTTLLVSSTSHVKPLPVSHCPDDVWPIL